VPRGASDAHALGIVGAGVGPHVGIENAGEVSSCSMLLQRVDDLDQAGVVIVERTEHGAAIQFAELGPFLAGARRVAAIDHVEPRQRTHAVDAIGIAQRLVVGGLEIGPGMDHLAHVLGVGVGVDSIGDDVAAGVQETQLAVVEVQAAIGRTSP
jgi:hypothetical protein